MPAQSSYRATITNPCHRNRGNAEAGFESYRGSSELAFDIAMQ
jgi:hypothetical protein